MRLHDLRAFYDLLGDLESRLGGPRRLRDCSGRDAWPLRGVYFFMESGECRSDSGDGSRTVRVGTHGLTEGSGTKLWTRLSQHKGVAKTGGGNHRGSIFRSIVGAAIKDRDGLNFPTWGEGSSAPRDVRDGELELECRVSMTIGAMPFLWLRIEDTAGPESLRGFIERNSIALLSNFRKRPLDPPSTSWLGHHSDRKLVRKSGLWNSNHVADVYEPNFLNVLKSLIKQVRE